MELRSTVRVGGHTPALDDPNSLVLDVDSPLFPRSWLDPAHHEICRAPRYGTVVDQIPTAVGRRKRELKASKNTSKCQRRREQVETFVTM